MSGWRRSPRSNPQSSADQNTVVRVARPQRHVCFAFGQVDVAVAENELDLQVGVAIVEALEQAGLGNSNSDRLRAGKPHCSDPGPHRILQMLLEGPSGGGDAFGMGQHPFAKIRQAIAALVTLYQGITELAFKLGQPALDGGLIDLKCARSGQCTPVSCNGYEILQIIPVVHGDTSRSMFSGLRETAVPFRHLAAG